MASTTFSHSQRWGFITETEFKYKKSSMDSFYLPFYPEYLIPKCHSFSYLDFIITPDFFQCPVMVSLRKSGLLIEKVGEIVL